jgi:hypothetical protein
MSMSRCKATSPSGAYRLATGIARSPCMISCSSLATPPSDRTEDTRARDCLAFCFGAPPEAGAGSRTPPLGQALPVPFDDDVDDDDTFVERLEPAPRDVEDPRDRAEGAVVDGATEGGGRDGVASGISGWRATGAAFVGLLAAQGFAGGRSGACLRWGPSMGLACARGREGGREGAGGLVAGLPGSSCGNTRSMSTSMSPHSQACTPHA